MEKIIVNNVEEALNGAVKDVNNLYIECANDTTKNTGIIDVLRRIVIQEDLINNINKIFVFSQCNIDALITPMVGEKLNIRLDTNYYGCDFKKYAIGEYSFKNMKLVYKSYDITYRSGMYSIYVFSQDKNEKISNIKKEIDSLLSLAKL